MLGSSAWLDTTKYSELGLFFVGCAPGSSLTSGSSPAFGRTSTWIFPLMPWWRTSDGRSPGASFTPSMWAGSFNGAIGLGSSSTSTSTAASTATAKSRSRAQPYEKHFKPLWRTAQGLSSNRSSPRAAGQSSAFGLLKRTEATTLINVNEILPAPRSAGKGDGRPQSTTVTT